MNRWFFSKKNRLLKLSEFFFVFNQSKRIKVLGMTLYSRLNQLGYPRVGLAISKRYVKHAYERNRIKRYARETFRMCQYNLSNTDFVLTVHSKEILDLKNDNLTRELKKLWNYYQYTQKN